MAKRFLVGVSNIYAYSRATNELLFTSKTMMDTAIEVSTGSTEIAGGQGNPLQYIYFHSPKLEITLTDTQFNLGMIAANVGSSITTNANVWYEESIAIVSNAGTATKTPIKTPDSTSPIYGWFTDTSGVTQRVTFTGSAFSTTGLTDQTGCLRYYITNNSARQITIPANFIPANVRLVMDCQLASSDTGSASGSSIIGRIQFEIGSAQLSGAQSIAMTSDGVANTPLKAQALADTNGVSGCTGAGIYGKITEILDSSNWYDLVTALAIVPDPVNISAGTPTKQLTVYAIPTSGSAFVVPNYLDLTFTSGTPATCTINTTGLITRVATGSSIVSAVITNKSSVQATTSVVSA